MRFWLKHKYPVHSLKDNRDLTAEQYDQCVALAEGVQRLYDDAPGYVARNGLDPAIALPGNEWSHVPERGLKFPTGYLEVNYIRLQCAFSGYHLLILDRLFPRRFPGGDGRDLDLLSAIATDGLPKDIVEIMPQLVNMPERLKPMGYEQEKHTRNVPPGYVVSAPRMMGEIGLDVGGVVVNPDTLMSQSRINALLTAGIIDRLWSAARKRGRVRILEVGAGYGALACALKAIFGDALEVVVVDLPSSLYHSALYLNAVHDGAGCHLAQPGSPVPDRFGFLFVANYLLEEMETQLGPIDLAINTMSFQEMSAGQVRAYAALFGRLLREDGLVFDENENDALASHHVDSCSILSETFPMSRPIPSLDLNIERKCRMWSRGL